MPNPSGYTFLSFPCQIQGNSISMCTSTHAIEHNSALYPFLIRILKDYTHSSFLEWRNRAKNNLLNNEYRLPCPPAASSVKSL